MRDFPAVSKVTESNELLEHILPRLDELASQLKRDGIDMRAYDDSVVQKFLSYDKDVQNSLVKNFCDYYELCWQTVAKSKTSLKDTKKQIWLFMQKNKLKAHDDLFDRMQEENLIEIYSPEFIQIYRNHVFFEISTYQLGYIFFYPYTELYGRPPFVSKMIADTAIKTFAAKEPGIFDMNHIPVHDAYETGSEKNRHFKKKELFLSPLMDMSGNVHSIVAVGQVDIVSDRARPGVTQGATGPIAPQL